MPSCLYLVQMDVPQALEPEFNRLYNEEHLPRLMTVSGVYACTRYCLIGGQPKSAPKYLAAYELEAPEVRQSRAWQLASDSASWKAGIRPFTTNKSRLFYRPIFALRSGSLSSHPR